jgi:hypothetical protein
MPGLRGAEFESGINRQGLAEFAAALILTPGGAVGESQIFVRLYPV